MPRAVMTTGPQPKRRRILLALVALACLAAGAAAADGDAPAVLDPSARFPEGPAPSEYWDLVGHLDTGHYLFARFMFTHLGPGDQNAVAIGYLVFPDGQVHRITNLKPGLGGQISPDGLRIDVVNTHLDLGDVPARLDVTKPNTKLHMEFTLAGREQTPAAFARRGYGFTLLDAAAPMRGTFFHPEEAPDTLHASGRAAVTHTWIGDPEPDLAAWRIDFVSLDGAAPIHLIEVAWTDGSHTGWLTANREGDGRVSTTDVDVALAGRFAGKTRPGYRVPDRLVLTGPEVNGTVQLGRVLVEQDPLEDLKKLNWLVRSLIRPSGKPNRIWIESPYDVTTVRDGGVPQPHTGTGVVVITFFNPTPQ